MHNNRLFKDLSEIEFPSLTEEYVRSLTFGTYQIKQAKPYTREHLDDEGKYYFEFLLPKKNLRHEFLKLNALLLLVSGRNIFYLKKSSFL
jgi:hypothetical protein